MSIDDKKQIELWEHLYDRIQNVLEKFGEEDSIRQGDYWVHDNYWGRPQVKIYIHKLALLKPPIIELLQASLAEFPGWEIVVAVSVRGVGEVWPDMGLTIRQHEIVDGLQRQYFPKEFQNVGYAGSRPGTDRD